MMTLQRRRTQKKTDVRNILVLESVLEPRGARFERSGYL